MESVKTKKATKMVAYKQLQKRYVSMVGRSIYRCRKISEYSICLIYKRLSRIKKRRCNKTTTDSEKADAKSLTDQNQ